MRAQHSLMALLVLCGASACTATALKASLRSERSTQRALLADGPNDLKPQEFSLPSYCGIESIDAHLDGGNDGLSCFLPTQGFVQQQLISYSFDLEGTHNISLEVSITEDYETTDVYLGRAAGNYNMRVPMVYNSFATHYTIYPEEPLKAGSYAIVLRPHNDFSLANVRVDIFRQKDIMNQKDHESLKLLAQSCCTDRVCGGILQRAAESAHGTLKCYDGGDMAGTHCSSDGGLVYLNLASAGMKCSVKDALYHLNKLTDLESLDISGNVISGTFDELISDVVDKLPKLRHLHVARQGGLRGSLPTQCSASVQRLESLDISYTAIDGQIPACMLRNMRHFYTSHNAVSGPLPDLPTDTELRIFDAAHDPQGPKFTGPTPNWGAAKHLHTLDLTGNQLEGILMVPRYCVGVRVGGNKFTNIRISSPSNLQFLDLSNNQLAEVLPQMVAEADRLVALWLGGNNLRRIPDSWASLNLVHVSMPNNLLQGEVPAFWSALPYLHVLDLSHNKFTGIARFQETLAFDNKLRDLKLNDNELRGFVFPDAMMRLWAMSSASRVSEDDLFTLNQQHRLDLSNNELGVETTEEFVAAYVTQVEAGIPIEVDLRGNREYICPNKDFLDEAVLSEEEMWRLGCSDGGDSSGVKAGVVAVSIICALLGSALIVAFAVFCLRRYRRRQGASYVPSDAFWGAQEMRDSNVGRAFEVPPSRGVLSSTKSRSVEFMSDVKQGGSKWFGTFANMFRGSRGGGSNSPGSGHTVEKQLQSQNSGPTDLEEEYGLGPTRKSFTPRPVPSLAKHALFSSPRGVSPRMSADRQPPSPGLSDLSRASSAVYGQDNRGREGEMDRYDSDKGMRMTLTHNAAFSQDTPRGGATYA